MLYGLPRYRSTMMCRKGLVASSHPLASVTGLRILMRGGNAIDAAIATNAVLAVTQPNLCGLGGDLFCLIYSSEDGKVYSLNGSGRSGRKATLDYFASKGYKAIPHRGPLAAITVPGCVHAWEEMVKKFGSMDMKELLKDAIELAGNGFPVSHNVSSWISHAAKTLSLEKLWSDIFLPNGKIPNPGEIIKQKDLAKSLKLIAEGGSDAFYKGPIAEEIVGYLEMRGGLLTLEDFSSHSSSWEEPVRTNYRGYDVYETPPNSQGITVLHWLNLIEDYDIRNLSDADRLNLLIETMKVSYDLRNKHITDPSFYDVPVEKFLSKDIALRSRKIVKKSSSTNLSRTGIHNSREDDTTYFAVVDEYGNCVSCIQSLYFGFGSGVVGGRTGILLQNRGAYFSLDRNHHNRLEPGKRTFHTLCACMIIKDNEPYIILGSMGGDVQPQVHVQLITSIIDLGMDVQEAIESPRWCVQGTIYDPQETVYMEDRFPEGIVKELVKRGHKISLVNPLTHMMGHSQAIIVKDGVRMGGADPRGDGVAIGY